jgi:ubiquitin C-terminal hydrolase
MPRIYRHGLSLRVSLSILFSSSLSIAFPAAAKEFSTPPLVPPTGLRNLGNTCYLNAQLQCAYHIPLVRSIISSPPAVLHEPQEDELERPPQRPPSNAPGLQALRAVFADMAAATQRSPVTPRQLTQTLGISVMEQQDSQEFWKLLLPALDTPPLTDLYQGAWEDYIVAQDGSGREKRREETFLDVSLDITAEGSVPASLAAAFGQAELLRVSEGNGWRPEKGADKVDALKGSLLRAPGLPPILQLHLKRFTYDWQRDVMEKNNQALRFSDALDLSTLCENAHDDGVAADDVIYDLQSIVIHMGQFGMGHYYAYVRPDLDQDCWFRCNDDEVEEVSFEEVLTDAIGGRVGGSSPPAKKNFLQRIAGAFRSSDGSYGFGGSTSNAYVLQYVKRSEKQRLYHPER